MISGFRGQGGSSDIKPKPVLGISVYFSVPQKHPGKYGHLFICLSSLSGLLVFLSVFPHVRRQGTLPPPPSYVLISSYKRVNIKV